MVRAGTLEEISMKIIIEYVGIDREQANDLARALSIAADKIAEKHSEIGIPDKITVIKDGDIYAH